MRSYWRNNIFKRRGGRITSPVTLIMDLGHVKWKEYSNLNETFIPLDSQNATHFTILEKKRCSNLCFFHQQGTSRNKPTRWWWSLIAWKLICFPFEFFPFFKILQSTLLTFKDHVPTERKKKELTPQYYRGLKMKKKKKRRIVRFFTSDKSLARPNNKRRKNKYSSNLKWERDSQWNLTKQPKWFQKGRNVPSWEEYEQKSISIWLFVIRRPN